MPRRTLHILLSTGLLIVFIYNLWQIQRDHELFKSRSLSGIDYYQKGESHLIKKEFKQALDEFKLGLLNSSKKEENVFLGNIGTTYSLMGEYQKAIKYFNDALILGPNNAEILKNYKTLCQNVAPAEKFIAIFNIFLIDLIIFFISKILSE